MWFVLSGALNLPDCLGRLEAIGLTDLQGAELMNRRDTKFPVMNSWISGVVDACAPTHKVLEVSGIRAASYRTLFYDTPDRRCWTDHVRGRGRRFKVRIRNYGEGGATFLEIKHKTPAGATLKERWLRAADQPWDARLSSEEEEVLQAKLPGVGPWSPSLRCDFTRATLVSTARGERITLDVDLRFADVRTGDGGAGAGGLAILEIKQTRVDRNSPAHRALDTHLGACFDRARPQVAFYLAGVDVVAGDRFGRLALTRDGLAARDRRVLEEASRRGVPLVLLLSGGYARTPEETADLHAEVHRQARNLGPFVGAAPGPGLGGVRHGASGR